MKKTEIKKQLRGLFNSNRFIGFINVCNVAWKNLPYMVIENYESFEDAKKNDFVPIEFFKTQEELINSLYKMLK